MTIIAAMDKANGKGHRSLQRFGKPSVSALRPMSRLIAAMFAAIMLHTPHAQAQWWSNTPVDFEECADIAERTTTRDARAAALTECNAKFAGRRKPGGGYTYYDFMQNRSFDIAGPNPTTQEQKMIDEQYTAFLDRERRSRSAEQVLSQLPRGRQLPSPQLQLLPQQASLRNERVPLPIQAPNKRPAPHHKGANCTKHSFSCDFPLLSQRFNELKRFLVGLQNKNPG